MKRVLDDSLIYEILSAVEEIPEGRTATYGQIACLIGREKNARLVGKVLSRAEYYGSFPVTGGKPRGKAGAGWPEQADLLRQEGVPMKDDTHVDLKKCRWEV